MFPDFLFRDPDGKLCHLGKGEYEELGRDREVVPDCETICETALLYVPPGGYYLAQRCNEFDEWADGSGPPDYLWGGVRPVSSLAAAEWLACRGHLVPPALRGEAFGRSLARREGKARTSAAPDHHESSASVETAPPAPSAIDSVFEEYMEDGDDRPPAGYWNNFASCPLNLDGPNGVPRFGNVDLPPLADGFERRSVEYLVRAYDPNPEHRVIEGVLREEVGESAPRFLRSLLQNKPGWEAAIQRPAVKQGVRGWRIKDLP